MRARLTAAALLTLALSACGTTVPAQLQTSGQGGLGPELGGPATTGTSTTGSALAPTSPQLPGGGAQAPGLGGTTGTGSSAPGVVRGNPGALAASGPIKVGIVTTGTSNASSFGVSFGGSVSEQDVAQAIVDGLNARGGLKGRKIVPVFAATDTGSSNWETDFSAACAKFTQDNKVEVVLGYVFNYFASFERCLAAKGIPHLNTGFNIPDNKELSAFPLHVALDVPTIGRRSLLKLDGATADGVITTKSRIGVLRDTCPGTGRSYDEVFLPFAKAKGLTVSKDISINCPNGNSDSGSAVAALQSAVLQFASARVDQVFFHMSSEGPPLLIFSLSAESQGYRPGYVVSSLGNLDALKGYLPAAQRSRVHGYGWLPIQDVRPADYPSLTPPQKRCLALLKLKGIKPVSGTDFSYAYNLCEALFVYELGLGGAGTSRGDAVIAAVKRLGTSFPSATNAGGSAFDSRFPDAPRFARHVVFTASCSCFRYTGPARPIPLA